MVGVTVAVGQVWRLTDESDTDTPPLISIVGEIEGEYAVRPVDGGPVVAADAASITSNFTLVSDDRQTVPVVGVDAVQGWTGV